MANSSQLSLPTTHGAGALRRATTVASYGGTKRSRMRERGRRADAGGADDVLDADRDAGERPGVVAGGDASIDRLGRGQGLGVATR